MPARLKLLHACEQCHSSRVFTFLPAHTVYIHLIRTLKAIITNRSFFAKNVYVSGCTHLLSNIDDEGRSKLPNPDGWSWVKEAYIGQPIPTQPADASCNPAEMPVYINGNRTSGGGKLTMVVQLLHAPNVPPFDLQSRHDWGEASFPTAWCSGLYHGFRLQPSLPCLLRASICWFITDCLHTARFVSFGLTMKSWHQPRTIS
jgi:hypothetical protein